jgi:caffeoyl-CoA O-methyltransferase
MSSHTGGLDPALRAYLQSMSARAEDPTLAALREATACLEEARMQISVEQGRLMGLLTRMLGARRALEVGVFTGYSALCVARELPPGGRLIACDISEEWTSVARRFWREAGVDNRIELRLGPAEQTLANMIDAGESGTFDFAFVDADKEGYAGYYEQCLRLLRPGGTMAFDNAFLGGAVVAPGPGERAAAVVRTLTERAFEDPRVDTALVPIGDGLLLVRKRDA